MKYVQPPLSPEIRPTPRNLKVDLDMLPPDEDLISQPPTAEFLRSIDTFGVQTPIILIDLSIGMMTTYEVAAGRRRIKAARAAGLTQIPARVYKQGDLNPDVISLIENEQRSANLKNDFAAIERLLKEGYPDNEIRKVIGISAARYRAIRRIANLSKPLRALWLEGKMSDSAARAAAKLTPNQQGRLEAIATESGKVQSADVKAAKRAIASAAISSLSDDLFANVPDPTPQLDNLLARVSDEELLAEIARRGLTAS